MITLPNFLYPGGESKLVSSILAVIFPASSIVVTPSTVESQPLMFPKVILAFSTWKRGISVKITVKFHEALRLQNTGLLGLNWICIVYSVCMSDKQDSNTRIIKIPLKKLNEADRFNCNFNIEPKFPKQR